MSIQKFLQDVSYDNICQEAMQALSTDIKFDIDVTIPILKIAYLRIDQLLTKTYFKNIVKPDENYFKDLPIL